MLFHIYLFVLFAGIGIGSVEYIRWCERSLPASADIPPEIALTFDDGPHPGLYEKVAGRSAKTRRKGNPFF